MDFTFTKSIFSFLKQYTLLVAFENTKNTQIMTIQDSGVWDISYISAHAVQNIDSNIT